MAAFSAVADPSQIAAPFPPSCPHAHANQQPDVSTTLVPPTYYLVRPRGRPSRVYDTLSDVAAVIRLPAGTPATVNVLTGSRRRSLTDAELLDLGQHLTVLTRVASSGGWLRPARGASSPRTALRPAQSWSRRVPARRRSRHDSG
jgi:hypothetical protein